MVRITEVCEKSMPSIPWVGSFVPRTIVSVVASPNGGWKVESISSSVPFSLIIVSVSLPVESGRSGGWGVLPPSNAVVLALLSDA